MGVVLLGSALPAGAQEGIGSGPRGHVVGRVVSAATRLPLAGVAVRLAGTDHGSVTDSAGSFRMSRIPVGTYTLEASGFGYRGRAVTDVIVRSERITTVQVELSEAPLLLEGLIVRPSYFPTPAERPVGGLVLGAEEIRRAPGAGGDVSRILLAHPGLAKVNDQTNSLVVRGGSPFENGFLVDGVLVPNINHFPTQGASGGPIGILNVDLLRRVDFAAGGFPVVHGDRLSSMVEIDLREGNRTERDAQVDLNFAGFGGVAEGPLRGGGGSWLVSARRSYLDLLVNAVDVGTSVAPRYGDVQGKVQVDAGRDHVVYGLAVVADSHSESDREDGLEHAMLYYGRQDGRQRTLGAGWNALWSEGARSSTTLGFSSTRFNEENHETVSGAFLLRNRSTESLLQLRHRTDLRLSVGNTVRLGADIARISADYDSRYGRHVGPLGDTVPELLMVERLTGARAGAFLEYTAAWTPRLSTVAGLRADWFSVTDRAALSPRLAATWEVSTRTSVSGSVGLYRQTLPLVLVAQSPQNRELDDPRAMHYILGLHHLLADDTRLTLELYRKDYERMPLDPDEPALFPIDELFYGYGFFTARPELRADGRARSEGGEALLQKKLSGSFHGVLSAAYFRTRYRDADGVWRNRVFDNRLLLSAEGGWKVNNSWAVSARWTFAGGPPYTPMDSAASLVQNRAVLDANRINGARYPAYHTLNVRADRRFHFTGSTLAVYVDVWNAYNRKNLAAWYWDYEARRPAPLHQWGMLPIFGLEYEF